jgi:acyl carrier protein
MVGIREIRIINTYKILQSELNQYGRKISLPSHTDPRKTYCWRHLSSFLDKYDALEFDDNNMPDIISAMVTEAQKRKQSMGGVSILNSIDIISALEKKLEIEINGTNNCYTIIRNSKKFLEQQQENLLQRVNKRTYPNIIKWYDSGRLTIEHIIVSKKCREAIKELSKEEKQMLPNTSQLIKLYLKLTTRKEILEQIQTILGNDFYEEKQIR